MNPFYSIVAERAGYACEYCRAPDAVFNFPLEVDHFVPLSAGGTKDLGNLVLACRAGNAYKAFHQSGAGENQNSERLFNPRRDIWEEHFEIDRETFAIMSSTEVGRGTINRLRINAAPQLKARRLWNQFGIYP